MDFEWDPAKARANLRKHGVSFSEAATVFADPYALWEPDRRNPQRGNLLGTSAEQRLLFVVHVEVHDELERIRIISARRATRVERKRYEEEE